ncbi:hypothetical protein B5X24_HaOG206865 [Helicoverpa armigera]|uniref:Uncharacterized protein n=1 Tax=Helicoverpa armigera TaxID=29058 RepID=A0A2W1BTA7_HELAM|nr:hypothetical protein B5X24_HaOG206865 [Helicoverpa armigera]
MQDSCVGDCVDGGVDSSSTATSLPSGDRRSMVQVLEVLAGFVANALPRGSRELEPRSLDVAEGADQVCASATCWWPGIPIRSWLAEALVARKLEEGLADDVTKLESCVFISRRGHHCGGMRAERKAHHTSH